MKRSVTSLLTLICMAVPGLAQEKPACPAGDEGDWHWQARSGAIWIQNKTLEIGWQTVGGDAASTGITLAAGITPENEVRTFSIRFDAPFMFPVPRQSSDGRPYTTYLFGERGEYGLNIYEQGGRPEHNYYAVALTADGETSRRLFASRVEQWRNGDYEITASWATEPGEMIDWSFTTLDNVRVGLATQLFKGGGTYNPNVGWDDVALTEAIDLTALPPIWEMARAAVDEDRARASESNQSCQWAY